MSVILVIDTIQPQYRLAIYRESRETASVPGGADSKTSLDLTPQIRRLLAEARIEKNELTAVGIYTCPVSGTGAQIGQATAEALALGLGIPLLKIDLLNHFKNSIEPEKVNNSMVLIKITGKYFAWANVSGRGSEAEESLRNPQPPQQSEELTGNSLAETSIWRQGTLDNFKDEIKKMTKDENNEYNEANIISQLYVSEQIPHTQLASEEFKDFKIMRLII